MEKRFILIRFRNNNISLVDDSEVVIAIYDKKDDKQYLVSDLDDMEELFKIINDLASKSDESFKKFVDKTEYNESGQGATYTYKGPLPDTKYKCPFEPPYRIT